MTSQNAVVTTDKDSQLVLPCINVILQENINQARAKVEEQRLYNLKQRFARIFIELSWRFFCLKTDQLKTLNDDQLAGMGKLLTKKARWWLLAQKIFTYGVPIVGWCAGSQLYATDNFLSWRYRNLRRKLQSAYGKNYFPADTVREMLG